jgi:aspartate/methionine/tyrosine aminotransferase
VPADLAPNRLAAALAYARRDERRLIDLSASNPTRAGFSYDPHLLAPLADARGLVYAPEPFGLREAREAVAAESGRHGIAIDADAVAITASTSEAYSLIFKVLCDPGDEVLVPRPSYPLFDHLTRLDGVVPVGYDLEYHGRWSVDAASIARALSPRTRAVLVVSPNNPTGNFVSGDEMDEIESLCAGAGIAVIADEVFADYNIDAAAAARAGRLPGRSCLGFSLGGLSKSVGLPQVKLGWIVLSGPLPLVDAARGRLELACDTYLSVSTPVQAAARELLAAGAPVREAIQARVRANFKSLDSLAAAAPSCTVLRTEGGWYAVMQVPSLMPEEDLVLQLLATEGVLVHPGYFFDFPRESYLVLSLLTPEPDFAEGVRRILRSVVPFHSR